MNFSVLPPEINSLRMFLGAGSAPMLQAAAAWSGLADELGSAANSFSSVTSDLAGQAWQGPAAERDVRRGRPVCGVPASRLGPRPRRVRPGQCGGQRVRGGQGSHGSPAGDRGQPQRVRAVWSAPTSLASMHPRSPQPKASTRSSGPPTWPRCSAITAGRPRPPRSCRPGSRRCRACRVSVSSSAARGSRSGRP